MQTIQIAGLPFEVAPRYAEGHTLNANEANALNQMRAENLRNNFAKTVNKAKEEHGTDLPPEVREVLQGTFNAFEGSYEFGVRAQRQSAYVDPVHKIAHSMMVEKVKDAIRAKGGKVSDHKLEDIKAKASSILDDESHPTGQAIWNLARERHEQEKSISGDLLSGLGEGLEAKQAEPAVDAEGAEVEAPAKGRKRKAA